MDGYDSSYYGYQWAEVVGDELFTALGESVGAVAEPGRRYREEILAPGATRPAAELVRAFLGRDPTPDSWLRYRGS
jgi:Zn-dependent oligopeptidase